jgi:hypothetical protein
MYANEHNSLEYGRSSITEWLRTFENSTMLVLLEGHAQVDTGLPIYASRGGKENKCATVEQVQ